MSKTEEVEPYTPHSFEKYEYIIQGELTVWGYRYHNGKFPYGGHVAAKDELDAFIKAVKDLRRKKRKNETRKRNRKEKT